MATTHTIRINTERWERMLAEHAGLPLAQVVAGSVKAYPTGDDKVRVTFEIAHDMSYEDFNRILNASRP